MGRGRRKRIFTRRRRGGGWLLAAALVSAGAVAAALAAVRVLEDDEPRASDLGPVHVHAMGVNPADRSLFIATHTGLFRLEPDAERAERVGDRYQDTMGFTVAGRDHFLGSGHPDVKEAIENGLPPLLGLIESTDAGESWEPVSLLGEADFHVLRFAGERVYGYDSSNGRLLVSADRGRTWKEVEKPGPIVDLAVDPGEGKRIVAAAATDLEQGLYESRNGGASWKRLGGAVGLLAWPGREKLYLVDDRGEVFVSPDGGRRLEHRGAIGGAPAALLAQGDEELYVALHDGTIKRSSDAGATWAVRSTP